MACDTWFLGEKENLRKTWLFISINTPVGSISKIST